jgi:hypothetical protein
VPLTVFINSHLKSLITHFTYTFLMHYSSRGTQIFLRDAHSYQNELAITYALYLSSSSAYQCSHAGTKAFLYRLLTWRYTLLYELITFSMPTIIEVEKNVSSLQPKLLSFCHGAEGRKLFIFYRKRDG